MLHMLISFWALITLSINHSKYRRKRREQKKTKENKNLFLIPSSALFISLESYRLTWKILNAKNEIAWNEVGSEDKQLE